MEPAGQDTPASRPGRGRHQRGVRLQGQPARHRSATRPRLQDHARLDDDAGPRSRGVRHPHELRRAEPSRRGHVARRQCRSSTPQPAGLLDKTELQLNGATAPTPFVTGIDYDAKGRRTAVGYGNGVRTHHTYDPLTMRQTQCRTIRGTDALQDLGYVYDPMGNVTHIQDDAQQTLFFNNQVVTPSADYTYDAVYRLCRAEGREHIGQVSQPRRPGTTTGEFAYRARAMARPCDGSRNSTNTTQPATCASSRTPPRTAAGRRRFSYDEPSLIEPGTASNRLTSVVVGKGQPERFGYDAHGNVMAMAHLAGMEWDFRDQLRRVDLGGGGTAYYVYDAAGERVRTVVEKNAGNLVEERITLAAFEVFRRRNAAGTVSLERQSLHVMDGGQRIALVDTCTLGIETGVPAQLVRFQLGNHLGSAVLELDGAGQIISYEEYYPYGATSYQAGRNASEVSLKRYRYTGQERDSRDRAEPSREALLRTVARAMDELRPDRRQGRPQRVLQLSLQPSDVRRTRAAWGISGQSRRLRLDGQGGSDANERARCRSSERVRTRERPCERKALDPGRHLSRRAVWKADSVGAHPHRQRHVVGRIDRGLERVCEKKRQGELDLRFGRRGRRSCDRYDAKTKSFEVSLFRPGGTRNFKLNLNPKFEPKNMETGGPESKWLTDEQLASRTKSTSPPLPRLPRTRIKALVGEVVGIAGIASVAGEVIKDLHEGHPGRAAVTRGRCDRARLCLQAVSPGHGVHGRGRHDHGV